MSASLDHLYLLVSDLDRAVAFYEQLGFNATRWGDYVRLAGPDGMYIGMEQGRSAAGTAIELVIRVDDVDRRYEELVAEAVAFEGPPADEEWGARHAWLMDPDGNRLSLFSTGGDHG
jgi:catechol 2,3-dioxygenase-like lactoylglutathione lyase family enzyme